MVAVYIFIGIIIGALLVYIIVGNKQKKVESQLLLAQQQLSQNEKTEQTLQEKLSKMEADALDLNAKLTASQIDCAQLNTKLSAEKEKNAGELQAQKDNFNAQMKTMQEQFANLAQQVLDHTSEKLKSQNNENIEQLTRPLKVNIEELQKAIQNTNETTNKSTASLSQQLRDMAEQTTKIDKTATHLASVIKGGNKAQGNWGELILTNILDAQGLKQGIDYDVQTTITDDKGNAITNDENGRKMIPDVILHYPNNEDVVIDSKMSIDSYSQYMNTEDEAMKQKYANDLVKSIRTQATNLAKKDYSKYIKVPRHAIDFVIMFVPNEGALQLAFQKDPGLWLEAFNKQVFITSQQNLMAILRMIHIAWRQYAQTESQKKVFDLAEELLNRIGDFIQRFDKIESDIDDLGKHYTEAMQKVKGGRQSIAQKANELKELGVKESANHPIPKIEEM
jgi:DNA recombination protein RmuC